VNRIGAIVAREIREALPATIFFLFLFHLIGLTKAVSLDDYSITALRAAGATVAALIVAKAILVVEALPMARLFSGRRISQVVWKTLLYSLVALLFRFVEELIALASKHGDLVSATKAMYREVSWPLFAVLALWILGGLFLYCLASELADAVGRKRVKEILFSTRSET
jgi:ABC-type polysaccharide transport system permease subunit